MNQNPASIEIIISDKNHLGHVGMKTGLKTLLQPVIHVSELFQCDLGFDFIKKKNIMYKLNARVFNPYKPSVLLWDIGKQCRPRTDAERGV